MEERCRRGDREKEPEARLRAYQAAVGCYRGDLLPRLSGEIWVMPLETYYHGLYAGAVSSAIEILEDCGRTEELAALCRQAVKIEPYKEEFYEHLMCALIENGDNREAMAVYDDMSEMLFSDFGVMPGETLRELYRQASRTVNDHTLSMDELRMQLQEENSAGGAMPGNPYGNNGMAGAQAVGCSCCDMCTAMMCMDMCCGCGRGGC